jgi:hypothetical protein
MELKGQDLLVLFKQVSAPEGARTYAELGEAIRISASQAHRSVQRCIAAGLAVSVGGRGEWRTIRNALLEFAVHGVRYAFPAKVGPPKRGIPTSFGTAPLNAHINSALGEAPVWPDPKGTAKGPTLTPICPTAPQAALADTRLHEFLALLDALRTGRARERELAAKYMSEALGVDADE